MSDLIEMLRSTNDEIDIAAADEIERLAEGLYQAVVNAAKDMTSERAYWNPDTGCYDLYKSNGTLEQLIEALDALEDKS